MKKLLSLSLITLALISFAAEKQVRAVYTYPSIDLTTNHIFKLYLSTDPTIPMINWTLIATQNTTVISTDIYTTNSIIFTPYNGSNYVTMTSSNELGESSFYLPAVGFKFNPAKAPSSIIITKP